VIAAAVIGIIVVAAAVYLVLRKPSEGGAPSFTISVSPKALSVPHGGSENLTIIIQPQVPSRLGYEVEGLPAGVQYSGGPILAPPFRTFVLTFTVAENVQAGSYPATVVCENMDSGLRASDNFTLIVT